MVKLSAVDLTVWADGSGTTAEQPGGWAYVLVATAREGGDVVRRVEGSGSVETNGTNNRMELTAVLQGLRALERPARVTVRTDSAYVVNCFLQDWFTKWDRRAWRKVKNADLWRELRTEAERHWITWEHVKGHSGVAENERCDELAGAARRAACARATFAEPDPDRFDQRIRVVHLTSDQSSGEFGVTAADIAAIYPDDPTDRIQASLDRLDAAGWLWRDSKGYRSRTCPTSYNA